MRIFIISRGYPTIEDPQWGCFERDQAEALAAYGHKVIMLSVDTRFRMYWRKIGVTEQHINGVHSINLFYRPSVTYLGYIRRIISVRLQFLYLYKKAIKQFGEPDILYSHYLNKSFETTWLARKVNKPLVGIEHWSELMRPNLKPSIRWMGEHTYKKLDTLLTVSQCLSKKIYKDFHVPSQVVYNTLGTEFKYQERLSSSDTFQIVITGSLLPIKRIDVLIQALGTHTFSKDWHLTIIGVGSEQKKLQSLTNQLGLFDKITFANRLSKSSICQVYQTCDLYVSTSKSETFGVAITEALACGLPVVCTRSGGPEEFINEHNGLLVDIDDVTAIANAIEQVMTHPNTYNRETIAADCKARFAPEVIAKQLTTIFEETIANYKKA